MSKKSPKAAPAPRTDFPVIVSFGLERVQDGWVTLRIKSQGDQVVGVERVHEPDMRAIAVEQFRIATYHELFNKDV